jgi:heptosyltransferase III
VTDSVTRIVAIRPGALGDTLLALPALALLRRRWPGAHLTFVARGDIEPIVLASGLADACANWQAPEWGVLFAATPPSGGRAHDLLAGADVVVAWLPDPEGDIARLLRALGVRRLSIAPGRPPDTWRKHAALFLLEGLAPLDIQIPTRISKLSTLVPVLQASSADEQAAASIWAELKLSDLASRPIALHPGSGGAAKRWPPRSFAGLIERIAAAGMSTLLVEGPQDAEVVGAVLSALTPEVARPPAARALSAGALAAVLARCAAFVGNDSGVAHLAGLVRVPTLVLFGPTDPVVWAPLGPRVTTTRAQDGEIAGIMPAPVWQALSALLARASEPNPESSDARY